MSRQPAILLPYDPAEAIGVAEAARRDGKGERTIRDWCASIGSAVALVGVGQ